MPETLLTLVSLGPDDPGYLTQQAMQAMRGAHRLILRTGRCGAAGWLREEGIPFETLDALYEGAEDFDALTGRASSAVAKALSEGDVCYALPDVLRDATVPPLLSSHQGKVRYVPGVSLADAAAIALTKKGHLLDRFLVNTALSLPGQRPEGHFPQAVTEIDNPRLAGEVKLWLLDLFDEEMPVLFFENAGTPDPQVREIPLYELDRQERYDHRTLVLVPPVSVFSRKRASYEDFAEIVAALRGPDGCPWDRAQTHESLRRYMLEEASEAAEALNGDDPDKLCDELGDVLLQVVLNAQVALDHGNFSDRDVTTAVTRKMIRRHPHVFADAHADSAGATHAIWEEMKKKERGQQSLHERLAEIPASLPALLRAQKVALREKDAGVVPGDGADKIRAVLDMPLTRDSLGEALFALARMAEEAGLDAEGALSLCLSREVEKA